MGGGKDRESQDLATENNVQDISRDASRVVSVTMEDEYGDDVPVESGVDYRSRSIYTPRLITRLIGLHLLMIPAGVMHALLGALLLELGQQTGAHLDQLTLLFTWNLLGRFLSTCTVSAVFDRLHPELQLGMICLLFLLSVCLVPFSQVYALLAVAIGLLGYCGGYSMSGTVSTIFYLLPDRKQSAPVIQSTQFAASFGFMLAPIIVKPFLTVSPLYITETNISSDITHTPGYVITDIDNAIVSSFVGWMSSTLYPMLIVGALVCLPTILCWIQVSLDHCKALRKVCASRESNTETSVDYVLMALLMCGMFCAVGLEITYGGLLYTYAVVVCKWEERTANQLITVYWATYLVARGLSVLILRIIPTFYFLLVAILNLLVMLMILALAGHLSPIVLWITSIGISTSCSLQFGLWMIFCGEHFKISGRMVGVFMGAIYLGGVITPAVTGQIFKMIGPRWLPHIILVMSILVLADFIIIHVYVKWKKGKAAGQYISHELAVTDRIIDDTNKTTNNIRLRELVTKEEQVFTASLSSLPM